MPDLCEIWHFYRTKSFIGLLLLVILHVAFAAWTIGDSKHFPCPHLPCIESPFLTVFLSTFFPVDVDVRSIDFILFIICIYDDSYLTSHLTSFVRNNQRSIVGEKKKQAPYHSIALINFELHFFAEHCLLLSHCFYFLINAFRQE